MTISSESEVEQLALQWLEELYGNGRMGRLIVPLYMVAKGIPGCVSLIEDNGACVSHLAYCDTQQHLQRNPDTQQYS